MKPPGRRCFHQGSMGASAKNRTRKNVTHPLKNSVAPHWSRTRDLRCRQRGGTEGHGATRTFPASDGSLKKKAKPEGVWGEHKLPRWRVLRRYSAKRQRKFETKRFPSKMRRSTMSTLEDSELSSNNQPKSVGWMGKNFTVKRKGGHFLPA